MKLDNHNLGIAALILALLVLVAGDSYRGDGTVIDPKELAYKVEHELDHVSAIELAHWIMDGKKGFRLVDLRDSTEFSKYHIPKAENRSLTSLVDGHFAKREPIVLYSEGGVHSAQAMFLLWAQGYKNVFMLKGGMNEWNDDVLHPHIVTDGASPSQLDSLSLVKKLSMFFGNASKAALPPTSRALKSGPEHEKTRDEC